MNKPLKTFLISILSILISTPLFCDEPINLRLLHFNDVYEVAPKTDPLGQHYGGFAELKTLINQKRGEVEHSLLTFGGDLFPATVEAFPLSYQNKIRLMNLLGIDAAVLGNHEFDNGAHETLSLIELSTFPWIVGNIEYKGHSSFGKAIPYKLFTFGNYKIALIGFILPETKIMSMPGPDVAFFKATLKAIPLVSKLKKEGVDVIIALTHQTLKEDKELLKTVPKIDLILGGHEHRPITYFINQKQMIFKAGYDGEFLGLVDLKIERYQDQSGQHIYIIPSWQMIPVRSLNPDATLGSSIQKFRNEIPKLLSEPLAKLDIPLNSLRSDVDSKQTSMGSLIATAFKEVLGTEIAFLNGGSIRGNRLYPKGSFLTRQNIMQELPFKDYGVVCSISGAQLKEWLENSMADSDDPNGSFPQVAGFTFTYAPKAKGNRRIQNIRIGGKPLDPQKKYSLATVTYLTSGKDGFSKISPQNAKPSKLFSSEIVIRYLEKKKVVKKEDILL